MELCTKALKTRVGRGLGQFDVAATEKQHRDELGGGVAPQGSWTVV